MKKVLGILLTLVLCLGLTACGGLDDAGEGSNEVSGNVSLNGSTSMEKFVNALKESNRRRLPKLNIRTTIYWFRCWN